MKDLKKLTGAKTLSKNEQKSIKGGKEPAIIFCDYNIPCPDGMDCLMGLYNGICE